MLKINYKKEDKDLYFPKKEPSLIQVPLMNYVAVKGSGDPNEVGGDYQRAMKILYGISYTIKMSKNGNDIPAGYHDYVIPPLEGLWDIDMKHITDFGIVDKSKFNWVSMIRLPAYVDEEIFTWAKDKFIKKNPDVDISNSFYLRYEEGLCAQIMHHGSYDDEMPTIKKLSQYIEKEGYIEDFDMETYRYHHEIYLSDARKTKKENLKTVIRHPIRKK